MAWLPQSYKKYNIKNLSEAAHNFLNRSNKENAVCRIDAAEL